MVKGKNAKLVSWFTVGVQKILFEYFNLFNAKKLEVPLDMMGTARGETNNNINFVDKIVSFNNFLLPFDPSNFSENCIEQIINSYSNSMMDG